MGAASIARKRERSTCAMRTRARRRARVTAPVVSRLRETWYAEKDRKGRCGRGSRREDINQVDEKGRVRSLPLALLVLAVLVVAVLDGAPAPDSSARPDPFAPPGQSAQSVQPADAPISAFAKLKAERMLRERLPCLGCHTLDDAGGQIGPDLSTVGLRRDAAYIAAMIADPQRHVPGSAMPRTPMPAETRALIASYLATRRRASAAAPRATNMASIASPTAALTAGAVNAPALYARWCSACHGATGLGDGPNARYLRKRPPAHANAAAMSVRPDDALYDVISSGGGILDAASWMPPFGATLTRAEILALVAHIRTLCNCQGPDWSRDDTRNQ